MSNRVFIIAEAGVNHNGDINLAKKLIDVAAKAGADAVKFQTFKTQNLVSKNAQKASYQKETTDKNESQFEMIKKLELDENTHKELITYCKQKDITFLSTPFDSDSIKLLDELGLSTFKIPSGEITNLPYLTLNRHGKFRRGGNCDRSTCKKRYETRKHKPSSCKYAVSNADGGCKFKSDDNSKKCLWS